MPRTGSDRRADGRGGRRSTAPQRIDEVIATAAKLFREQGFDATSMQDVADELGILKGSLYHYIRTKEDLLWMIVRGPLAAMIEDARTVTDNSALDVPEVLLHMAAAHGRAFESQHPFMQVMTNESGLALSGTRRHQFDAMRREYTDLWRGVIDRGRETGCLREDVDAEIASFAVIGALNWMYRWFHPGGKRSAEDVAIEMMRLQLSGLTRT